MRSTLIALAVAGLFVASAAAQPYYVRGDFNSWSTDHQMVDDGDGTYSLTIDLSSQPAGDTFQFKTASADWSVNAPPNNAQLRYTGGPITFHFLPNFADDGWNPPTAWVDHRMGWDSTTDWEIMGSLDGFASPLASMTNTGDDVYAADLLIPSAGTHEFKFRAAGDWDINIGNTFSFNDFNLQVDTTADNELWRFELDLPNGRWRTSLVPEPASMIAMLLAGLLLRRR